MSSFRLNMRIQGIVGEIRNVRSSSLARNAGWMFLGQGLNLVFQAGGFILLARLLGAQEYGVFAGALAFTSLALPFSGLGSGLLFVRYVSIDHGKFALYWGNMLLSVFVAGAALTLLLAVLAPHLLNPASASIALLIALSECVCRQLVMCIAQIYQAFEELRMTATINLLPNGLRFAAAVAMIALLHHASAAQWALSSLLVSSLAAIGAATIVLATFGRPRFSPHTFIERVGEGLNFSLAGSTQSAYNDLDKAMLSHYGMNLANGIYTVAYRLIDLATTPVVALDAAALPRYFRLFNEDAPKVKVLSDRLAWRAVFLGLVLAVCLFFAAPLIPYVLGRGFSNSVTAVRWLCLIPVFRGAHQLSGGALTGMGLQRYRTLTQVFAVALNFGANLWLIPRYGWLGAAWASLLTDGALAVTNPILVRGFAHSLSAARRVNHSI